ncbi:hypothetical protein [Acetobacter aceti]|uniref:Uncharacterized protein n=1 Tax=Acetobacter aceti TaxID=435 RepID=A0A6S6PHG9_ACEAC|nr:hypothetical protein [Acetobacter aceti]BCI67298.1 hypothetical protein AAJCM20276_19220 [Acetobacter aceti]
MKGFEKREAACLPLFSRSFPFQAQERHCHDCKRVEPKINESEVMAKQETASMDKIEKSFSG